MYWPSCNVAIVCQGTGASPCAEECRRDAGGYGAAVGARVRGPGDWRGPAVIGGWLLLAGARLGCGRSEAPLIFAVKVITSVAPLKPPAGTMNGPPCGFAERTAGCRREPTFFPLITMLLGP